jgi:hypothetical protein
VPTLVAASCIDALVAESPEAPRRTNRCTDDSMTPPWASSLLPHPAQAMVDADRTTADPMVVVGVRGRSGDARVRIMHFPQRLVQRRRRHV